MVPREFGKAFGFNNLYTHDKEEAMASPPHTITRRTGKIPRSPIPQSIPQSMPQEPTEPPTDTPNETDEDTYDNKYTTPTPIRKRPSADTRAQHERISQPLRALSPSLIDALLAQNQRTEESNRQTLESNRLMIQTFMQVMKRIAFSRRASSL